MSIGAGTQNEYGEENQNFFADLLEPMGRHYSSIGVFIGFPIGVNKYRLERFLRSDSFRRVRGMLMKPLCSIGEESAAAISQIACLNRVLLQEAPSSPVITKNICSCEVRSLIEIIVLHRAMYSRWNT